MNHIFLWPFLGMNSTNNLIEHGIWEAWVINTENGDGYRGGGRQQRVTAFRMIENEWHHLRNILPHDNSLICSIPASQLDHKDKVKWGKLGRVSSLQLAEAGLHPRFAPLQAVLLAHTLSLRRREEVSGGQGLTLTGTGSQVSRVQFCLSVTHSLTLMSRVTCQTNRLCMHCTL